MDGEREVKLVSFSELDTLRQCGFKWSLAYGERWQSPTVGPALSRGTLFHAVLEKHYKDGDPGAGVFDVNVAAIAEALAQGAPAEAANFEASVELVEWMYQRYQQQWAVADLDWQIVDVERRFEVPLGVGSRSGIEFRLKGRIDLVVRDVGMGGGLWIVDHKTCSTLPNKELDLDDQMALYPWAMSVLGEPVVGVIYNACRTQRNKGEMPLEASFARHLIAKGEGELSVVADEALEEFDRMWADVLETRRRPPRRPNTDSCKWKCAYTEACLMSRRPDVPVGELLKDMGYERSEVRH